MMKKMKSLRSTPKKESISDLTMTMPSNNSPSGPVNPSSVTSPVHQALADPEIVERVHTSIKDCHVFKLPVRQSVSIGYRGADWKDKVWQGSIKVVEKGEHCIVLLVDKNTGNNFAVCPVIDGAVERCVDSSRYFVLRIENAQGRHMFIGVAFNERNDAFDFNTALQDIKKSMETEVKLKEAYVGPSKDYSLKEGQKIHVNIPKLGGSSSADGGNNDSPSKIISPPTLKQTPVSKKKSSGGFLAPSSKDTPSRSVPKSK